MQKSQFISSEEASDSSISVQINHINIPVQFNGPMNLQADGAFNYLTNEMNEIAITSKRKANYYRNECKRMKQCDFDMLF
jgi:hypothetical protein